MTVETLRRQGPRYLAVVAALVLVEAILAGIVLGLTTLGGLSLSYWQAVGWAMLGELFAGMLAAAVPRS